MSGEKFWNFLHFVPKQRPVIKVVKAARNYVVKARCGVEIILSLSIVLRLTIFFINGYMMTMNTDQQ